MDRRFNVQKIPKSEWIDYTVSNLVTDYAHGFQQTVNDFIAARPEHEFKVIGERLNRADERECRELAQSKRHHSLQFLVMMLGGACNADCPICFTDRRKKANELTHEERKRILVEAKSLGTRYVYVPGEGEPTIDKGFMDFLETCAELDLQAIVFTNGLAFSSENISKSLWQTSVEKAVEKLADYPVSFYVKLWSMDQQRSARLLGLKQEAYPMVRHGSIRLPAGLALLWDRLPRERVGVEVVIQRENYADIRNDILPFILENNVPAIIEKLQHNGRTENVLDFDIDKKAMTGLEPYLSVTSCHSATAKAVVTSQGFVSPRIAILEHQLPSSRVNARDESLYSLLHKTAYIVNKRYEIHQCLCETLGRPITCCANRDVKDFQPINPLWLESPMSTEGVRK